jgi:hypothetical protein
MKLRSPFRDIPDTIESVESAADAVREAADHFGQASTDASTMIREVDRTVYLAGIGLLALGFATMVLACLVMDRAIR